MFYHAAREDGRHCSQRRKVVGMRTDALVIRRVAHCDLDCFFAAVEELDDPSLHGRPVIVGGDPHKRGVVSTANYLARRYGVHSAMAASLARRLCPQAVFLRPRFERYRDLSQQVMTILDDLTERTIAVIEAEEQEEHALICAVRL